jgi:acyl-CoA reductase-like NAD-dependent aldehyde dehydrogenase
MIFKSINPYTETTVGEYTSASSSEIEGTLALAHKIQRAWAQMSFQERGKALIQLARYLRTHKDTLANLITTEMGKIIAEANAEVEKCAAHCEYYASHAEGMLQPNAIATDAKLSTVYYEPVGVVLAIMPWNFPFWQVFRYSIPALMAGNVTILKHAPNVFGCARAIQQAFENCTGTTGVFQSIVADVDAVQKLISDDRIAMVTLTGSERAGASVAQLAGANIKKSVLELGGSDALLVLRDADVEKAATAAVQSRMLNAGQVCIAAKRFIVEKSIKNAFTEKVLSLIQNMKQGDPMDARTQIGPLARLDLAETLEIQVKKTIDEGGRLLAGGQRNGCNFSPTLFDRITPQSTAFVEETFGPVAVITEANDEREAVLLANQSRYGLSAAIWTEDIEKATTISRQLEAGSVFVNAVVRSDSRLPIGGIKKSGYGRELSEVGIKEFCYAKTFYVG